MGRIVVDDSQWPLVQIFWPDGGVSDQDVEAFLALGRLHLERRQRFLSLHHGMRMSTISAKQRRVFAEHVREYDSELAQYMTAAAIVTPSAVIRAVVRAIHWIAPPPYPQETFASAEQAERWLREVYAQKRAG